MATVGTAGTISTIGTAGRNSTAGTISTVAPVRWSVESLDSTDPVDNPPLALGRLLAGPAETWPDRTAIDDGQTSYTFAQLEQGAQTIAARLAELGVRAGDRVAILAEKRSIMPMLAVAVWKCGGVYAPLDGSEPAARVQGLLTRLAPAVVIALDDRVPVGAAETFLGGPQLAKLLSAPPTAHPGTAHPPEQAAYIVWAASPAGEPQGVEVSAAALLAYFASHNQALRITAHSRVLSLAPFHVDVSLEDTLLPLSLGAFVYQFRNLPAGPVMRAVLSRERITHLIAVSMLLAMITGNGRQLDRAKLPELQAVMTGAQVCDPGVVRCWREQLPDVRFLHAYGPPEATVFSIGSENEPPGGGGDTGHRLGRPLPGVTARIVRDGVELRDPGVEGELWIGGERVMRGYFDRPAETSRVLVELDGTRWFRTGDICSLDADGTVVFHRHGDSAITWLAGRRTHLSELDAAALACPGVERVVTGLIRRNQRDVIALVVLSAQRQALASVIGYLREVLPDYLRPTVWAWAPADAESPATGEKNQLLHRLGSTDQLSTSINFALSDDGVFEPMDEV